MSASSILKSRGIVQGGIVPELCGGPRDGRHMSPFDDDALGTYRWESAGKAANFVTLRTLAARGTDEFLLLAVRGIR